MATENTDTFEETLVQDIEILKSRIEESERVLGENKKILVALERALIGRRKNVFFQKYGFDPLEVTLNYSTLLQNHSHIVKKDNPGYKVTCPDYNLKDFPGLVLTPEHREKCLPTQMVTDAYAFYGKTVSIADELSYE